MMPHQPAPQKPAKQKPGPTEERKKIDVSFDEAARTILGKLGG